MPQHGPSEGVNVVRCTPNLEAERQRHHGGVHRHLSAGQELDRMPWVGREAETREMCAAILAAQSVLPPSGSLVHAATNALVVLELAAGNYAAALELVHRLHGDDPSGYRTPGSLPDMVEAGIRGGDRSLASRAIGHLAEHVSMWPTPWSQGVLARSRALQEGGDPEPLYREAISQLRSSGVVADLARAHLLYGEWLRRQKRRAEARSHLRTAHDLFVDMGADCFAQRAAVELVATGERARQRTVDTRNELTPQERHIATLVAAHATNREIGERLFISARTVEYHLHHIFQKLQISSRRQLSAALARTSDVAMVRTIELEAV